LEQSTLLATDKCVNTDKSVNKTVVQHLNDTVEQIWDQIWKLWQQISLLKWSRSWRATSGTSWKVAHKSSLALC